VCTAALLQVFHLDLAAAFDALRQRAHSVFVGTASLFSTQSKTYWTPVVGTNRVSQFMSVFIFLKDYLQWRFIPSQCDSAYPPPSPF
jgi:hypothetical protein